MSVVSCNFIVTSVFLLEARTGQELAGSGGTRFGVMDGKQMLLAVHEAIPFQVPAVIPTTYPYRAIRHTLQVKETDILLYLSYLLCITAFFVFVLFCYNLIHVRYFGLVVSICPLPFRLAASVLWC